jgi:hypothetical protein
MTEQQAAKAYADNKVPRNHSESDQLHDALCKTVGSHFSAGAKWQREALVGVEVHKFDAADIDKLASEADYHGHSYDVEFVTHEAYLSQSLKVKEWAKKIEKYEKNFDLTLVSNLEQKIKDAEKAFRDIAKSIVNPLSMTDAKCLLGAIKRRAEEALNKLTKGGEGE